MLLFDILQGRRYPVFNLLLRNHDIHTFTYIFDVKKTFRELSCHSLE